MIGRGALAIGHARSGAVIRPRLASAGRRRRRRDRLEPRRRRRLRCADRALERAERSFLDDTELASMGLNTLDILSTKSFAIELGSKIIEVAGVFGGASGALRARHWRIGKPD